MWRIEAGMWKSSPVKRDPHPETALNHTFVKRSNNTFLVFLVRNGQKSEQFKSNSREEIIQIPLFNHVNSLPTLVVIQLVAPPVCPSMPVSTHLLQVSSFWEVLWKPTNNTFVFYLRKKLSWKYKVANEKQTKNQQLYIGIQMNLFLPLFQSKQKRHFN